jgi:predicted ATPase/DNA-binding CsgD family transcriptional regulator
MRSGPADATLLLEALATIMSKARTENTLRVVGRQSDGPKSAFGGKLPLETTSFVGRGRELAEVEGLLGRTRLLTLVGVGGSGKTRLALRAARLGGGDGVWWVELASLPDVSLVPRRVASALGVAESPGRATVELLVDHLERKEALLVLDNCEHVIEGCAELADALLRSCPGLKILTTSREPLGVPGEVSWPVPPLSLPEAERGQTPYELLRYEAVGLFVERASAVVPGFVLTEANAPALAELCARLDGMPLAIELAASRVRMLSVGQVLERLDDRLRFLRGNRTAVPRHRTLGATIDWSHDLLSEPEKILFRRLSVFAGGWTLSAAEEVCAGDGIEGDEVLDLLSSLVDKSLVVVVRDDEESRYRMLETVRQYASDTLGESAIKAAVRAGHASFMLDLAEKAETGLTGPEQALWLGRLEKEHDNLRAALGWFAEEKEVERGLRLAAALVRFWWFRGYLIEGRARLESLLGPSGTPVRDQVRAKALHALAVLIYRQADYAAGDWSVARFHLDESLTIYRRLGDEARVAAVLQDLGRVCAELGEWNAARDFLDESMEIGRRSGDEPGIALSLFTLGRLYWLREEYSTARNHIEEGFGIFWKLEDSFWIDACLAYLGYIDCEEGKFDAARSRFVQTNEVLPLTRFPWGATYTLEGFARLAAAQGEAERALRLGGATAALRRTYGVSIGPSSEVLFRRSLEPAWRAMTEEESGSAWAEGRKMTLEQALSLVFGEPTMPDHSPEDLLSDRELEVLSLVAKGLSDAEVAENLYLSPRTVGGHLRGVYRKLGVKSRTAAVMKASELGLLKADARRPDRW